jgi:hypothetical protein
MISASACRKLKRSVARRALSRRATRQVAAVRSAAVQQVAACGEAARPASGVRRRHAAACWLVRVPVQPVPVRAYDRSSLRRALRHRLAATTSGGILHAAAS